VEDSIGYLELIEVIKDSGYSRIPVYKDNFDHVVGILYAKDLLGYLSEGDDFNWLELVRSNVLYVPEAKKIDDMLKEFQRQRNHMAIVVDEYGGTSGIVTLEDIMEEVVGEIRDEFDEEEELEYEKLDDLNYIFDGKFLLSDFCRVIGKDISMFESVEKDADSLAGLILELVGQFPKPGSEHWFDGYKFKVVKLNKRRIEKIHVTLPSAS
jgi:CBS domain containing-hemolysin-like protein